MVAAHDKTIPRAATDIVDAPVMGSTLSVLSNVPFPLPKPGYKRDAIFNYSKPRLSARRGRSSRQDYPLRYGNTAADVR